MAEPLRDRPNAAICVDFGSTFTKTLLVDLDNAQILAAASHPTTVDTDVLDGYDACLVTLAKQDPRTVGAGVFACSSAGGGLRIAVVGNEELVTAEAGRRVALSSGGKVVEVIAAAESLDFADRLVAATPDLVLLTGGTDGGNAEVLVAAAEVLVGAAWQGPVVVAGNVDARDRISTLLGDRPHVHADNVVPRIGELRPESARAAVREMFLAHVIGGKHLSARSDFLSMLRGATPDVVLTAVELLAVGLDESRPGIGDVVVVDVGGATTDVHSFVEVDPEDANLGREVVATTALSRTVEGDLGMRWSAPDTVVAAVAAGILVADPGLTDAAAARLSHPSYVPETEAEAAYDEQLATGAIGVAVRRHAGRARVVLVADGPDRGRVVERSGKDLREVALVVGSGGILRATEPDAARRMLAAGVGAAPGGWQLPETPRVVIDHHSVLAAAGLLAEAHPQIAHALLQKLLSA